MHRAGLASDRMLAIVTLIGEVASSQMSTLRLPVASGAPQPGRGAGDEPLAGGRAQAAAAAPSVVDSIELLTQVAVTSKSKFLPRKPRSLLFHEHLDDWMVSSTLDGSVQPWSLARRAMAAPSLHLPSFVDEACFAEDMCLNHRGTQLAVVLGEPARLVQGAPEDTATVSLKLCIVPVDAARSLGRPVLVEPSFAAHSKSIASVCSFYDGPSDTSHYLTGSADRCLALWEVGEAAATASVKEVHRRHTSAIHAVCQQPQSRVVWTGGSDMRLVGFSLGTGQALHDQRLEYRVAHVLGNRQRPDALLVVQTRQQEQIRMLDTRSPFVAVQSFGWAETSNTSRYLKPSWHPAGNLVACGLSNAASHASGIHIWDLRYAKHDPLQLIEGLPDKKYWSCEFHPRKDLLAALATDGTVSFIDYALG